MLLPHASEYVPHTAECIESIPPQLFLDKCLNKKPFAGTYLRMAGASKFYVTLLIFPARSKAEMERQE